MIAYAEPCLTINNWERWVHHPLEPSRSSSSRDHVEAYGIPSDRTSFSEHFAVHWGADLADESRINDILGVLEMSLDIEVDVLEMPDLRSDRFFNVYLGDTGQDVPSALGVAGYYDLDVMGNPMIVLGSYVTDSWSIAKTTIPHELFHALQHISGQYQTFSDRWYWESSATWVEQEVFPNYPSHADFLFGYALYPHLPLTQYSIFSTGATEEYHAYGSFIFLQYLTEHFVSDSTIGTSWTQDDIAEPLTWWRSLLLLQNDDLGRVLSEMAAHNVYWDYSNQVIYQTQVEAYASSLPDEDNRIAGYVPLAESQQTVPTRMRPGMLGYNHWRLESGTLSELWIDFDGTEVGDYFTSVNWRIQVVRLSSDDVSYSEYTPVDGVVSFALIDIEEGQEITISVLADAEGSNTDERFNYALSSRVPESEKRGTCSYSGVTDWWWLSLLIYGRRRSNIGSIQ